jgi:hypothetical protein
MDAVVCRKKEESMKVQNEKGFTIIEWCIVISILSLLLISLVEFAKSDREWRRSQTEEFQRSVNQNRISRKPVKIAEGLWYFFETEGGIGEDLKQFQKMNPNLKLINVVWETYDLYASSRGLGVTITNGYTVKFWEK